MPIDPNEVVWDAETPNATTTKINPAEVKWDEPTQSAPSKPDAKQYMREQFKNIGKPDPISQALMHIGSSMFAKPASEIAGMSAMGNDIATGDVKNSKAKEFQDYVRNKLTYEPETKSGEVVSDVAGLPGKAVDWASGKLTSGLKDHPTLQSVSKETLEQLANFIGLKGTKALKESPKFSDASVKAAADSAKLKSDLATDVNRVRQQSAETGFEVPAKQAGDSFIGKLQGILPSLTKKAEGKASEKNADLTNELGRKQLGMAENIPLTSANYNNFRTEKGKVYNEVENFHQDFSATTEYRQSIENIKKDAEKMMKFNATKEAGAKIKSMVADLDKGSLSPKDAVFLMKKLREDAKNNIGSAQRGGGDTVKETLGKAQKDAAKALEGMVDQNLAGNGRVDLADKFKEAREKIAQSYTMEKHTNKATGDLDAAGLFSELTGGKPLGPNLKKAAEFAGQFPRSAQKRENIPNTPMLNNSDMLGAVLSPLGAAKAASKPLLHMGSTKTPQPLAFKPPAAQAALNQLLKQPGLDPAIVTLLSQKLKQKDENK